MVCNDWKASTHTCRGCAQLSIATVPVSFSFSSPLRPRVEPKSGAIQAMNSVRPKLSSMSQIVFLRTQSNACENLKFAMRHTMDLYSYPDATPGLTDCEQGSWMRAVGDVGWVVGMIAPYNYQAEAGCSLVIHPGTRFCRPIPS